MRNKLSVVLFTAFFLVVLISASTSYAADSKHPRTSFHPDRAPKFMIPFEPSEDVPAPTQGTISLNMRAECPPTNSPGDCAGVTYYDYQHNGSMGRQVAVNQGNGFVFMVWMGQTDSVIPGARQIYCQAYLDGQQQLTSGGYSVTNPDYAGYTSCAWDPDYYPDDGKSNSAATACHARPGAAGDPYFSTHYYDGLPNFFIFYADMLEGHQDSSWYSADIIWPIMDAHHGDSSNTTQNCVYLLSHVWVDSEDMILFRRLGDSLSEWDNGKGMGRVTNLSYTIAADPNSDMVVIAYCDDMHELADEGDGGQTDQDIYYRLSTDQGETWGEPVCVSNYSEEQDSLWRAYTDVSVVITPDQYLHIVAPVRQLNSQTDYENYKSRLIHWDIDLNTEVVSKASVIDEARYDMQRNNSPCDPDAWNMYLAKPSVTYCEGKLYALYTKFGDDNEPEALYDCSHLNFANGELYLAASDDMGTTWDTGWNLTNTRSPHCDSAMCESDHWSSMARYGMAYGDETVDDSLDIVYINDKDAGGIPQGSGTWCVNSVMYYRFPCRDVHHIPKISLEPNEYGDPLHTPPSVELETFMKISNIGNDDLIVSAINVIDEGHGTNWINVAAPSGTVEPGDYDSIPILFNYGGVITADPSGWDCTIEVDHDDPSDKSYIPVHLTVASDFNMPEMDSLMVGGTRANECRKLAVYNTARLGGGLENNGLTLNIPGDCDSIDTPPNELMYLFDASPVMAWLDEGDTMTYTTVFTQRFTDEGTYRPQSDLNFQTVTGYTSTYQQVTCTVTTSDSLYGVAIDLYGPSDGVNCFVVGSYEFFNWKPVDSAGNVYTGFILDWDIPADVSVDNGSGYAEGLNTIWQIGGEYDTLEQDNDSACGGFPIFEFDRVGGVTVLEGPLANAWTTENAPVQVGSAFDRQWLYTQMSTLSGYNLYVNEANPDTLIDLHTGLTFEAVDMRVRASKKYTIALVTTNVGMADYLLQVAEARAWAVAESLIVDFDCNCLPGDANEDGTVNIGDAVYVIAYVFKGGPAPTPYAMCSGDANCDGQCNIGDAVYVIAYVFKGGPAPCTCEEWVAEHGTPLRK
jgi:hypothetical protein